jgi:YVTN family beta-propeller protein
MAYLSSAFCYRRRRAAAFVVGIGFSMSLLLAPWFASPASGANPSPTTSVLVPSNEATLSGTAATLDASASNATSVKFLLFGGSYGYNAPVLCTATLAYYGWVCSWNTTTVPNGSYVLVSEASGSGGTAYSSGVSITIKNPLPTTSVVIPSNGATLSGTAATLDASVTNATSVKFLLFGGTYGYNAPVLCTAIPTRYGWVCVWNSTTVPDGSYVLVSEAFNAAGSAFSSGVSITVTHPITAYVTNEGDGTVTPIDTATNTAGTPITGVTNPWQIAITPNGESAYATDLVGDSVTPINLITNTAGTPITVSGASSLGAVAITPNGTTAYVANATDGTVVPLDTATNTTTKPITVGNNPVYIAITPNGATAYVVNNGSGTVTPITTASNVAGTAIPVGANPFGIAITPNGATAYVTGSNAEGNFVTPIDLATNTAGAPIDIGATAGFLDIAIAPNGATAYVTNTGGVVTPIAISTNTAEAPITVANQPFGIAITPDGTTAYVSTQGNNTVTPINLATNTVETPIGVGASPFGVAID